MNQDMVIEIAGYEVIISACDVERVNEKSWYKTGPVTDNCGPYFSYTVSGNKKTRLHRFIMNCPQNMTVDHINGNTLDNRRSNLRICTLAENNRNSRKRKDSTSG
jgi:hypothetical protein